MNDWINSLIKYIKRNFIFFFSILFILALIATSMIWIKEIGAFLYPNESNSNAEVVKILLSIIGGIGVLLGLYIANKRAVITEKTLENQSKQLEHAQKSEIDERFHKAIEHLGSDKEAIIMGGVAVLHQIACDNPKNYAKVVLDILTSYVRKSTNVFSIETKDIYRSAIQLIFECLFNSNHLQINPYNGLNIKLDFCNLSYLKIEGVKLENVDLSISFLPSLKSVQISNSTLKGCEFLNKTLENVTLESTDLFKTKFYSCRIKSCSIESKKFQHLFLIASEVEHLSFLNSDEIKITAYNSKIKHLINHNSQFLGSQFLGCEIFELDLSRQESHSLTSFAGSDLTDCKINIFNQRVNFRGVSKIDDLYRFKKTSLWNSLNEKLNSKIDKEVDLNGVKLIEKSSFSKCDINPLTLNDVEKLMTDFEKLCVIGENKKYHDEAMTIFNIIKLN